VSYSQNQHTLTFNNISDREGKSLKDEPTNLHSRTPSRPRWPHSRVFGNHLEGSRNVAQKSCTQTRPLCFVPVDRVVKVADRTNVELDSQALARPQAKLHPSAHFRPVFQLCGSPHYLARAPIKLFEPRRGRIGVFRFIQALNEFRRKTRAFTRGQFQKLRKDFAILSHPRRS